MLFESYMNDGLLWIDCETTGLKESDLLLEIAMKATDMLGNPVANAVNTIIRRTPDELTIMDNDAISLHTSNGLINDCIYNGLSLNDAADKLKSYVNNAHSIFDVLYPAGCTVSFDKYHINSELPDVLAGVHHRMVDLTSLNVLMQHLKPDDYKHAPAFRTNHRALSCISSEIKRYAWYVSMLTE